MATQAENLKSFDEWLSIRHKTAEVNLFARYAGTGPAILLLHGCPQHSVSIPL